MDNICLKTEEYYTYGTKAFAFPEGFVLDTTPIIENCFSFYHIPDRKGRMLTFPPYFPFTADVGEFPPHQLIGY